MDSSGEDSEREQSDVEEDTNKIKSSRSLVPRIMRLRDKGEKMKVEWNAKGQVIGKSRANFKSYIGVSTRTRVNINYSRWDQVPDHIKEAIWIDVSGVFDVSEHKKKWLLSEASERFRTFKSKLTSRCLKDKKGNIIPNPPAYYPFIDEEMWKQFIATRESPKFQEESEKHREIVKKNVYKYKGSRKGYAALEEEMILEAQNELKNSEGLASTGQISIPRDVLWKRARVGKDGNMDEFVKHVVDQMELVAQQADKGEVVLSGRQDLLATVLGKKDHPGRVLAAGSGVNISKFFGKNVTPSPSEDKEKISKMEVEIRVLKEQVAKLQSENLQKRKREVEITSEKKNCHNTDFPEGWTDCQLASLDPGHPIVAIGKVFKGPDSEVTMVHSKPLKHGHMKVTVTDPKVPDAPLPVATEEASIVFDALDGFVEWPIELIYLEKVLPLQNEKNGMEMSDNFDRLSEASNTSTKSPPMKVQGEEWLTIDKSVKLTTSTLGMMYTIAKMMRSTVVIPISKAFKNEGELQVTKEDIFKLLKQDEIGLVHVCVYIGYLLKACEKQKTLDQFGFLCPNIAEEPTELDGSQFKDINTARSVYIANAMEKAQTKQLFFAPYLNKGHWMLCVINPFKNVVFWLNPMGAKLVGDIKHIIETGMKVWIANKSLNKPNKAIKWIEVKCPHQKDNANCGYYVLRFIQEIIAGGQYQVPKKWFSESAKSVSYSQKQIDEVRDQWVSYVQQFIRVH